MRSVIRDEQSNEAKVERTAAAESRIDRPLVFESYLRPQVWGGDSICRLLGKRATAQDPIGESWEVSGLDAHPSVVARGPLAGRTLADLWKTGALDPAMPRSNTSPFPLFVKWLDCREFLSVQVHPGDELAREAFGQEAGKSEAWVVVDVEPTARVYAGLREGVTPDELAARLSDGTVQQCLHSFVPKVGDCISLPAGTIHSAGGGVVFAEVQQPCDLTFRMFDWNRVGLDGLPRPLHLDLASRSITWPHGPITPSAPVPLFCPAGVRGESLLKTPHFELTRYTIRDEMACPNTDKISVWMILEGAATLHEADGSAMPLERGATVLVPAAVEGLRWESTGASHCQLLCIQQP